MKFPFGKYKGRTIDKVPDDYLVWALENCNRIGPALRREIELKLGITANSIAPSGTGIGNIIGGWYRTLAKEFHPDRRRGSHEGMVAINRARELLAEMAGGEL